VKRDFDINTLVSLTLISSDRPDGTSDKTFASGAGGMGFKSRSDQICHTLPTNLPPLQPWLCGPWRKSAEMGTAHSWHQKGY